MCSVVVVHRGLQLPKFGMRNNFSGIDLHRMMYSKEIDVRVHSRIHKLKHSLHNDHKGI